MVHQLTLSILSNRRFCRTMISYPFPCVTNVFLLCLFTNLKKPLICLDKGSIVQRKVCTAVWTLGKLLVRMIEWKWWTRKRKLSKRRHPKRIGCFFVIFQKELNPVWLFNLSHRRFQRAAFSSNQAFLIETRIWISIFWEVTKFVR